MWYQTILHFSGVSITLAPAWRYFFWGFLLLAAANTVTSGVNLFRPYWTWVRASVRLISDCIGSALFCWFVKSDILVAISVPNVAAAKTAQITTAINWCAAKMLPAVVAVCVIIALANAYRIIRVRARANHPVVLNAASGAY
jgi:hypothetical protein